MRFLLDEGIGYSVANFLRVQGFDVASIQEESPGEKDRVILRRGFREDRIIVTNDKDFGELVFRHSLPHKGIVLLRLRDERAANKVRVLRRLLESHGRKLRGNFIVVTEDRVRLRGEKPKLSRT